MKNRKGEAKLGTILVVLLLVGFGAYSMGWTNLPAPIDGAASDSPTAGTTANCPSTGITTYTINVQDELTSSATNVDAEYYFFNGNKLIKEGTTGSDGTVDVDLTCGKDYKLLLLNTTAGTGNGLYSKVFDLQARTSSDTFNAELVTFGEAKILGIENPADPSRNANVTLAAGSTVNFDLKFIANKTERGYNRPIIMCEVNVSAINSVSVGSFSDGTSVVSVTTLPKRITATGGDTYYAWEYPKILTPNMGVITASGNLVALGSVTPSTTDTMACKIIDQATWKTAGYKISSTIDDGFKTSAENTETLADVGGPDSSVSSYTYINAGGY